MRNDEQPLTCEKCSAELVDTPDALQSTIENGTVTCREHRRWAQRERDTRVVSLDRREGAGEQQ